MLYRRGRSRVFVFGDGHEASRGRYQQAAAVMVGWTTKKPMRDDG